MAGRNRHTMSPDRTGNIHQALAIKQEEYDRGNSNLDWASENRTEKFTSEEDSGVKDAKMIVKKEADSSANEAEASQSIGQMKRRTRSETVFPERPLSSKDFGFIRTCLGVVLTVDSKKRHELVRAMSSKLKYIEAIATGKIIAKASIVESENLGSTSLTKLVKQESNSRRSDKEEGFFFDELQCDSRNESDEEMKNKVMNSSDAVTSATVGLVSKMEFGSVKCNVCERVITNVRRICTACSSYVSRTRWKCRESGTPLPSCHHKNFSGGASCRSCRLRKYILLSRKAPQSPTQRRRKRTGSPKASHGRRRRAGKKKLPHPQKCLICEKKSFWFNVWRCTPCFVFHSRMIDRYRNGADLPTCVHDGSYAGAGCKGCRRIRLQREAALRDPELASRLPEVRPQTAADADENDE